MRSKNPLLAIVVLAVVTLGSTPAYAQFYASNDRPALVTSTTTTTTAVVAGTIVLTVVLVMPDDDSSAMESYLRDNQVMLARDLSLGAGPTVEDLAAAFHVEDEDLAAFGRLLRSHRDALLRLADPARLDDRRAHAFVHDVLAAMGQSPRLARYVMRIRLS